ncbi:unnamed protein product [Calypogeia fissa]
MGNSFRSARKENASTLHSSGPQVMLNLKPCPPQIRPFVGRSDVLTTTKVPVKSNPRLWYLENPSSVPPPCISSTEFVPTILIEHLMRKKKNSALGVKFQSRRDPPDAITNMEGAMHTFVTPILLGFLHGDYIYKNGHSMTRFTPCGKMQQARTVLISAQIQLDFEGPDVLLPVCALQKAPFVGQPLPENFTILDVSSKQDSSLRERYDTSLRRHMVANLTRSKTLPSLREVAGKTIESSKAVTLLENLIRSPTSNLERSTEFYVRIQNGSVIAMELLFNVYVHQLRNELSALEALCPQGYVYTFDPPSIFALEIGATILNRLQFAALKHIASMNNFANMRVFAFNDYADRDAVSLVKTALSTQSHVTVLSKSTLFEGPKGTYSPLAGTEGSLLVIHNNSDGFGQNIETEWESGSLDGAIGANSSAAASLERARLDLVANVM